MKARRLSKSSLEALLLYGICVCVITFLVVKGVRENFEWLDAFGLCVVTYFACWYKAIGSGRSRKRRTPMSKWVRFKDAVGGCAEYFAIELF